MAPLSADSYRYNVQRVGTLRDVTVVDTTGAGDAFIAGYIMSLVAQNLRGHAPFGNSISFDRSNRNDEDSGGFDNDSGNGRECSTMFRLRFASWVAGRKLEGPGAQSSLPSAKDVSECLGVTYDDVEKSLSVVIDK